MDKKPILLVILLALVIVTAYVGFVASTPTVTQGPAASGEVRLQVTGPPSQTSSTTGEVKLIVV